MRRRPAPLLLIAAIAIGAAPAGAQVFLATRPNPEFEIGPLFIRASVGPELGPVTIDVLWSLAVPPTRSALGLEQDLYLLWPAALRGEERTAERRAARRSTSAAAASRSPAEGQLPLYVEDLYPPRRGDGDRPPDRRRAVRVVPPRGPRDPGRPAHRVDGPDPVDPDLVNRVRLVKLRL